jgi:purine-binding chemotaxis protein CheW
MINDIQNEGAQYLSFLLDGKIFAFDVLKTREVLSYTNITPIPCTPVYVAGVLNLRGSVVTVMNFRTKFGMSSAAITDDSAIIIVEANYDDEMVVVGALVDAVKGVLRFEPGQIEPPPKVGMRLSTELINGIGKRNDDFVVILNVDKAFSEEDLLLAKEAVEIPVNESFEKAGVGEGETEAVNTL